MSKANKQIKQNKTEEKSKQNKMQQKLQYCYKYLSQ